MPRKVFVGGEILTAADVNTNLMDQAVMVFADDTARTSAIPSPSEGMVTYLSDDDVVEVFDGSNFVGVATPPAILQVVSTTKTDAFSTSSGTFVDVTGLSVSITPSATSSKVFVIAQVMQGHSQSGNDIFNIVRDSTPIAQPTVGSQVSSFIAHVDSNSLLEESGMSVLDSPSTTSAVTYKIQMAVPAQTGFVNRRGGDDFVAAVSTITAMEVSG